MIARCLPAPAAMVLVACTTFRTPRPLNDAAPGQTSFHAVNVGGSSRTFLLHLPPASATHRVPLVFIFHGHSANAEVAMRTSEMNRVADSLGMAVLYPNGSGRLPGIGLSWNVGGCCGYAQAHRVDDVAFVDSLRSAMLRTGRIDSMAVFAAGFSAGGMLALKLACERSTTIRAVADLAGAMPNAACAPTLPVAVLFVHGDEDDELRGDHARHVADGAPAFAHSLDSAAAFWRRVNHCGGPSSATMTVTRRPTVRREVAADCMSGRTVQVVSIPEHPHAWPGGRSAWWFAPTPSRLINGSALVLSFFGDQLGTTPAPSTPR